MIYITGDTHGGFHRFNRLALTDEDIMIILGGWGRNCYILFDIKATFIIVKCCCIL